MKKQKDIFKADLMKEAHVLAKALSKFNAKSYRENLSIALKAKHIHKFAAGKNSLAELNWIKNNIPSNFINMWSIQDYAKDSKYTIKVYGKNVEIKQYLVIDQSYMNSIN